MSDFFINKNLNTYLKGYLKKLDFDNEDFDNVYRITLSSHDFGGNFISNSLEDLNNFKNLEHLHLSKYILNRDNISIIESLKQVKDYVFYDCDIKDKLEISGNSILISCCQKVNNFKLNDFKIVQLENIDLTDLEFLCDTLNLRDCKNLEKSKISYQRVNNIKKEVE